MSEERHAGHIYIDAVEGLGCYSWVGEEINPLGYGRERMLVVGDLDLAEVWRSSQSICLASAPSRGTGVTGFCNCMYEFVLAP